MASKYENEYTKKKQQQFVYCSIEWIKFLGFHIISSSPGTHSILWFNRKLRLHLFHTSSRHYVPECMRWVARTQMLKPIDVIIIIFVLFKRIFCLFHLRSGFLFYFYFFPFLNWLLLIYYSFCWKLQKIVAMWWANLRLTSVSSDVVLFEIDIKQ